MRTMVFKILGSSKNFSGIAYNEKKTKQGSAELLYHENFGYLEGIQNITKEDFKRYLSGYSKANKKVKKPQFHATLSAKGKEHNFEELKNAALLIMDQLGYKGNPILIYSHSDTSNNHLHIISSRVDMHGHKINDSNEGIRACRILDNMLGIDNDLALKDAIVCAAGYAVSTLPQFALLIESRGFKAIKDSQGYSFHKNGMKIGSVSFDRIALEKNISSLNKNRVSQIRALIHKYNNEYKPGVPQRKKFMAGCKKINIGFTDYLRTHLKLEFIFFHDVNGNPYGYCIIDHERKIVFKGSDVMRLDKLIERSFEKIAPPSPDESKDLDSKGHGTRNENNHPLQSTETLSGSLADAEVSGMHSSENDIPIKKKKRKRKISY